MYNPNQGYQNQIIIPPPPQQPQQQVIFQTHLIDPTLPITHRTLFFIQLNMPKRNYFYQSLVSVVEQLKQQWPKLPDALSFLGVFAYIVLLQFYAVGFPLLLQAAMIFRSFALVVQDLRHFLKQIAVVVVDTNIYFIFKLFKINTLSKYHY